MRTVSNILILLLISTMLVACGGDDAKNAVTDSSTQGQQNPVSDDSSWNALKAKVDGNEFVTISSNSQWSASTIFHYQLCQATGSVETDEIFGFLQYTVDTSGWDCTQDAIQRRESAFLYDGQSDITGVHNKLKSIVAGAKYYNHLGNYPKAMFDVLVEEGAQNVIYRIDLNSPLIANPIMKQVEGESMYSASYYSN
ncbi:MAG: hypothetical protein HN353_02840 [Bdellovibrionales bacterium]|jgi:hypothetical protein|nr:hypothetical protein [Bdellovibrionales bacterium]MBT3527158.1 hypothetical protein [Bdellovibrionales bacterium]MBT7670388.1 hypothetical protein [Bdellovibrionales bacterium]MBT7765534.1 hypothetical protein [Bdellovibrionales bacterium]